MSIQGIVAFNAAMNQMKSLNQNALDIQKAKQDLEFNNEKLDIMKRTKEADIKIQNNAGILNDYQTQKEIDLLKTNHQIFVNAQKAKEDAQALAENQNQQQMQKTQALAQTLHQNDPDVQNHVSNLMSAIQSRNNGLTGGGYEDYNKQMSMAPTASPTAAQPTQGDTVSPTSISSQQNQTMPSIPSVMATQQPQQQGNVSQQSTQPMGLWDYVKQGTKEAYGQEWEMNPQTGNIESDPLYKAKELMKLKSSFGNTQQTTLEKLGIDPNSGTPEQIQQKLAQVNPGYFNFLAGINDGKIKLGGRSSAVMNKVLQDAETLYPGLDLSTADTRFNVRKDFTSGQTSKNITALNTAIHHADTAYGQVDALDNGRFKKWNSFQNYIKNETGDPRVSVLQSTLDVLNRETNKAIASGVVTEGDKESFDKSLNAAQSKEVAKSVINNFIKLISGRTQPLLEKWQNAFPEKNFSVITPSSEKILQNHGFNWNPQTGDIEQSGQAQQGQGKASQKDYSSLWK